MPRRRRSSGPDQLELNLTPLLDVVLQLITFFMILIHFGAELEGATKSVRLPEAASALPSDELAVDRLPVAIEASGRLIAGGKSFEPGAADSWWEEQAERRRKGLRALGRSDEELPTLVILRADKSVPYGVVRKAMIAAQGRGFSHFTLVVLRSGRP